jgi:regulator of protease activity HflC (stomatin/prohibitin superfamily)
LLELLKTFYEAVGAPAHPRIWLITVFMLSGAIFTVLWWAIGKQYEADHAEDLKVTAEERPASHPPTVNSFAPPPPASPTPQQAMNANQAEEPWPAVRITMSDRSVCTVSLSVQIRILPENAPKVVVALGSPDEIRPFLKPVVESAVVTTLSGKTFRQISKESASMSLLIQKKVEQHAEPVGITVLAVHITQLSVSG